MTSRRVVVTGLGLVTPFGIGTPFNWQQITSGACGIKALKNPKYEKLPCKVAGLVPRGKKEHELNFDSHFPSSKLRTMSTGIAYSLIAADEALKDAKWAPEEADSLERTGVAIGVSISELDEVENGFKALEKGYKHLSPYVVPKILPNMSAGQVSIKYGFQGPNHCVSTACATGCHSVGDSFRMIKSKDADVMVCGATESLVCPFSIAGFCKLRALSTRFNENPELSSRPFDIKRDGFVMSEGAGVLVLEEYEHAKKREAKIYGEVLGYGMTGDANHLTAPRRDGHGAARAMRRALEEANVYPSDVGYINAHATSTPLGDEIEVQAIKNVFGTYAHEVLVSSTKGATGHLLGAAGAVESIFTILACHFGYVPETLNLSEPSPGLDLNFVRGEAKPWIQTKKLRVALCNSFGFGGTNASLCLASCD